MTWIKSFYLRALTILLHMTIILSDETGQSKPIIRQPPNDVIVRTENITIPCLVGGSPPLTIEWQKNGITLDLRKLDYLQLLSEGPLIIIKAQRSRDYGRYRCVVSNSVGKVMSEEAEVIFPYMDSFSMPTTEITVNEGDRALIQCHAPSSFPDRHIYWEKQSTEKGTRSSTLQSQEGIHYAANTEGNLYFSYTKSSDQGEYYCNVENFHLEQSKRRTVELVVNPVPVQKNSRPQIWYITTKKPLVNENFDLECIAYGRPVPAVKIRKVHSDIALGSRDGNKRLVRFRPYLKSDNGLYVCEVTNLFGEKDSRTFYLEGDERPSWLIEPEDTLSDIGESKTLSCKATGLPDPAYTWFFNSKRILPGKEFALAGGNLTISPIEKLHSGMYQCVARNIHRELISSIRLQVIEIPAGFGAGSTSPSNAHVLIGGIAEISCNPTGSPKPTIRWRKLSEESDDIEVVSQGRFTILPNGNLRIKRVVATDEGKYQCIVRNSLNSASKSAELFVRAKVAITRPPQATTAKVGTSVNLTCGVETASVLEVHFRWKRNFTPLIENSRIYTVKRGTRTSVLHIDNLKMTDIGMYTCSAVTTGSVGSRDTAEAYLTVVGVPGRPTEVSTSDFKQNKVRISWTLGRDNYSPVTKVHIFYRTQFERKKWHHMMTTTDIKSRGSADLSLSPWASYRFRVVSENGVGNSTPSVETFPWLKSLPAAPSRYPTEIKGVGTGPTEIRISWKPLTRLEQNGPNIFYNVYHQQSGTHSSRMQVDKVKYGSSLTVRGAEYYVQYEFRIQAGNDFGLGPMSPIVNGFTGERRPLGVPKDLQVQITSSRTAIAWWKGVKTDRTVMRGKFLGYKLFFWRGSWRRKSSNAMFKTTRANKTHVQLDPHTSYLFQVVAYNSEGDGPGSNIAGPYITPEDTPEEPLSITFHDAEMGQVNISWTDPSKPNGVIVGYSVKYKELPGDREQMFEIQGEKKWAVVKNLKPAALYQFSVAAKTKAGVGRYRKENFDFTWLPTVMPNDVRVTAVGESTVVLRWSSVNDPAIITYKVYWRPENNQTNEDTFMYVANAEREMPVNNLRSGTVYFLQVAAVNRYGAGPKTAQIRVKTVYVPTTPGPTETPKSEEDATTQVRKQTTDQSNMIPAVNENQTRSKGSRISERTLHYMFWSLITLLLVLR